MSDLSWSLIDATLGQKSDLSVEQAQWAMNQILTGQAQAAEIKSFLVALKAKGESAQEVSALVEQMYAFAAPIDIGERCVDTVGTGGDGAHTINISTPAAIITTAAGARVIKHGNRAASSRSGAADLLQALGVEINLNGAEVAESVRRIGLGFAFAPIFHPAMRFAGPARKELGVATVFNILGPLANPARPKAVAIGVADERMLPIMAQVLADRGCEGFLFRGHDGLDELSLSGPSTIIQIQDGQMHTEIFDPSNIGIERSQIEALVGGDAEFNANVTNRIFDGEQGAPRDAVLLNAAAAIAAFKGDFTLGIEQQLANGWVKATAAVDSGAAKNVLNSWRTLTHELFANRSQ